MKNWTKISLSAMAFFLAISFSGMSVKAGTVSSISATAGEKSISVTGQAESGVVAVEILVYDSTGTQLVGMESVAVNDSSAFSDSIAVKDGTYVVKAADYNGGAFAEATVVVGAAEELKEEPQEEAANEEDSYDEEENESLAVDDQLAASVSGEVVGNTGELKDQNGNPVSMSSLKTVIKEKTASAQENTGISAVLRSRNFRADKMWVYDITLENNGALVTELKNGSIRYTVQIPAGADTTKTFKMVRFHGNNVDVLDDEDGNPSTITFTSNVFSTYVLVEVSQTSPSTGEEAQMAGNVIMALSFVAVMGIMVLAFPFKKKFIQTKKG